MLEMKCPNCGAPLRRGWECEYCGSVDSFNVAQAVRDGLLTQNQARRVLGLEPEDNAFSDKLELKLDTETLARAFIQDSEQVIFYADNKAIAVF